MARRFLQLLMVTLISVVALAFGSVAGAVNNPDYTVPPPLTPIERPLPSAVQPARNVPTAPAPQRSGMPVTGSDVVQLVALGAVLVAGGAGIMTLRRRQLA